MDLVGLIFLWFQMAITKMKSKVSFLFFISTYYRCGLKYDKLITKCFIRAHTKYWNNEARIRFNCNFACEQKSNVLLLCDATNHFCCIQTSRKTQLHFETHTQKHIYMYMHAGARILCYIHNNGISFAIYETNNNYIIFQLCTVWQRSLMSIHNAMNSRQIINIVGCLSDYTNYTVH